MGLSPSRHLCFLLPRLGVGRTRGGMTCRTGRLKQSQVGGRWHLQGRVEEPGRALLNPGVEERVCV